MPGSSRIDELDRGLPKTPLDFDPKSGWIAIFRRRTEMDLFAIPFPLPMIHQRPLLCSKLMRFLPDAFLSKASLASES